MIVLSKVRNVTFEGIDAGFRHFGVGSVHTAWKLLPNHPGLKQRTNRMVIPEIDFGAFLGVKGTRGEGDAEFSSFPKGGNNPLTVTPPPRSDYRMVTFVVPMGPKV